MTDALRPADTVVAQAPEHGRAKLNRSIGVVGGTLLTLSCVTPASTLFVVVPDLFGSLGTATALTIAIGSLLCVAVAFCYSELGTLIPSAGGDYAIVSTLAGRLAGWLVFVLAPGRHDRPAGDRDGHGGPLATLTDLTDLPDLRANAWITGVFLVLEVIAAAVVALLGFTHAEPGPSSLLSLQVAGAHGGRTP